MSEGNIYEVLADSEMPMDPKQDGSKKSLFGIPEGLSGRRKKTETVNAPVDRNNPLGSKGKRLAGIIPNIGNPIASFEKKDLILFSLWAVLIGIVFYGYQSDVYGKIDKLPTKHKSLIVAKQNILDQKREIEYLDKLSIDSKELETKENKLDKYLEKSSPKVAFIQANILNQIINDSGVQVSSFGKSSDQREESRVIDIGKPLEDYKIGNFYENAWYNKYNMEIISSEEQIMRFMEETERVPSFIVDTFGLSRSTDDIKYSVIAKAFYLLSDNTNESN